MIKSRFLFKKYRTIINVTYMLKTVFAILLFVALGDRLLDLYFFNFQASALISMTVALIFCHIIEIEMYELNKKRFTYEMFLGDDAHKEVIEFTNANPELKPLSLQQMEDDFNAIKNQQEK